MKEIIKELGMTKKDVIKCTIFGIISVPVIYAGIVGGMYVLDLLKLLVK